MNALNRWLLLPMLMLLLGCTTPPAVSGDADYRTETERAYKAYRAGTREQAAQYYVQAMRRAMALGDAQKISDSAYNAATLLLELNKVDAAALYVQQSVDARTAAAMPIPWELQLLQAKLALAQGELERARAQAERTAQQCSNPSETLQVQLVQLQIEQAAGRMDAVEALIAELDTETIPAALQADVLLARAGWAEMQGNDAGAARFYEQAAEAAGRQKQYTRRADILAAAGSAYEKAGSNEKSGMCFVDSASAWFGLHRMTRAAEMLDRAFAVAEAASLPAVRTRAGNVLQLMDQSIQEKEK